MRTLEEVLQEMNDLPAFVGAELVNPNQVGNFGDRPLHVAAVLGDVEAVGILLAAGADANAQGEHGYTALHEAAEQGFRAVVQELLRWGADPKMRNDDGLIPLELARMGGNKEVAAILDAVP